MTKHTDKRPAIRDICHYEGEQGIINIHIMINENYSSLAFFQGLKTDDLIALLPLFSSTTYVAGTKIFEQGDKAENLYLVASGEVHIRYKPEDGPAMTVTSVRPGGIFGWSAAMGNSSYTSAALCSLDSEILSIPGEKLREVCKTNKAVGEILLDRLSLVVAERQKSQQRQLTSILSGSIFRQTDTGGNNGRSNN